MNETMFPPGASRPARQIALKFRDEAELPHVSKPVGEDVSALAVAGRTLFCACDETSTVERLVYDGEGAFAGHESIALGDFFDLPGGPEGEMDIEGLAVSGGSLWITGSHSLKRHGLDKEDGRVADLAKSGWDPNRGFLGCLPLAETAPGVFSPAPPGAGGRHGSAPAMMRMGRNGRKGLRRLLREDRVLQPFMKVPAKENGFDVEGFAVLGNRQIVGLRGPVIGTTSLLLSLRLERKHEREDRLAPREGAEPYRLHSLDLGGFGIRDLLADGDRLLVLAGPTQAIEGVQRIFAIEGFSAEDEIIPAERVREVLTLPMRRGSDHAEGIARFSHAGEDLLLVDYDSPADDRYDPARRRLLLDAYPFPLRSAGGG